MGLLRLLLALSVVIVHSHQGRLFGTELVGGQAAVQAFYVISGFYMALVLNRKYPPGAAGYRTFILARIFRLYPAYLFIVALTIFLAATNLVPHPAYARWREQAGRMSLPTLLLYGGSQLTLVGQDAVWFTQYETATGAAHFNADISFGVSPETREADVVATGVRPGMDFLFVAQSWTLGVELLFYLVAPFIVRRLPAIGALFVLSWVVRMTLAHFGHHEDPWSYRFFPSELAMFLMGSAGYHLYAKLEPRGELLRNVGKIALPLMIGVVLFLFRFPVTLRALIVACSAAATVPFIFALTKRNVIDRWIGELSYPVYITHELVRLALIHFRGVADVRLMVGVTLLVSVVTMLAIEGPVERLRARFIERRRARADIAAA